MRTLVLLLLGCNPDVSVVKVPIDADSDGYEEGVDCDDAHASVNPDAPEVCDGLDNDCNDLVDDDPSDDAIWYADADGDLHGDPATAMDACAPGEGYVADGTDCDDAEPAAFPGNAEVCDEVDNDCDGDVDEDATDVGTWYADGDGDAYGDPALSVASCAAPAGYVADGTDCDDTLDAVHPDAEESDCADPVDYNCDGSVGYADADGDGHAACEDCDDASAARNPAASEVCDASDLDEDCDGLADDADDGVSGTATWHRDIDGDAYGSDAGATVEQCEQPAGYAAVGGDCDDYESSVNPGAAEVCDAADTDEDCDGAADDADASVDAATWETWYADDDGDGHGDATSTITLCDAVSGYVDAAGDCDDRDAARNPGEAEVCDAADLDEDCDSLSDDADASVTGGTTWYADVDGDGYGDAAAAVTACAAPAGHVADDTDCDDTNAVRNPGEVEVCDPADLDEDCDTVADDADASVTGESTWHRDADGDGYAPTGAATRTSCAQPAGYTTTVGDCDDLDRTVSPAATETCDSLDTDEDCDGYADDADVDVDAAGWTAFYRDADGDTYGDPARGISQCDAPTGYVTDSADCDDRSAAISPADTEVCDGADADEDCDGLADDADSSVSGGTVYYRDADADGYGSASVTRTACSMPAGYAAVSTDCNDASAAVSPGDPELCDASDTDEDCDGLADDLDGSATGQATWYGDADGDGYGAASSTYASCNRPVGFVAVATDCDDAALAVNPGATEVCDAADTDEDCDGVADDASATGRTSWSRDADGDGYGLSTSSATACDAPSGYVADATDCNDTSAAISPADTEICDAADTDEDCDGLADDADTSVSGGTTYYRDADSDGYGTTGTTRTACTLPSGYVADATDCDDGSAAISPADPEVCDAADTDEDCDGVADDDDASVTGGSTWYADADGDGYGTSSGSTTACDEPADHSAIATDCDDSADDAYPGGTEACDDGIDQDCDGTADEGCLASGTYSDSDAFARIGGTASLGAFLDAAALGDSDGDGHDEFLLISPNATSTATQQGIAYRFEAPLSGTSTTASAGARITGEDSYDEITSIASAGDVDGDGLPDILVGAISGDPNGRTNEGGAWLLLSPVAGTVSLTAADGEISGDSSYDYIGAAVGGVGDLNGDGLGDFAVTPGGNAGAGDYVGFFYGPGTGSQVFTSADILVEGDTTSVGGSGLDSFASGHDLDGDGVADFVFGAWDADTSTSVYAAGAVWVVLGPPVTGPVDTIADYAYRGSTINQNVGTSVSSIGDLDGDGYPEISALEVGGTNAILYGPLPPSASWTSVYDASFQMYAFGHRSMMRGAGDLDGDGDDEVIVSDVTDAISGTERGVVGIFDAPLGALDEEDGEVVFTGDTDGDQAYAGTAVGDMNGDSLSDILVVVPRDDAAGANYGAAWLFDPR